MRDMELADCEVHVWWADLADSSLPSSRRGSDLLSPGEKARAERFRFDRDRDSYVVSHAVLRLILEQYVGREAAQLEFSFGRHGKPSVAGSGVAFNMSVSRGYAVYAVAGDCEVGIDVERRRGIREMDRVFMSFASEPEKADWLSLPADVKEDAFLRWWTRKEAVAKAVGIGLGLSLGAFDVSFKPGEASSVRGFESEPLKQADWTLVDVSPDTETVAALAVRRPSVGIRCRHWSGSPGLGRAEPATRVRAFA